MNIRITTLTLAIICCLCATKVSADIPYQINYQGTLTDTSGNPITDTRQIDFAIYADSTGGSSLWSETHLSVEIVDGLFRVQLGSVTALPPTLFDGSTLWLGIQVSPDLEELSPRQSLVTVPYGFKSGEADHAMYADTSEYSRIGAPDDDWTVNADTIYHLNGNVGIGTTFPAYKLHVEGQAISGYNSTASGTYSTISGGGNNTASGNVSTVGGGGINTASNYGSTVSGGMENTASGYLSTVGGGWYNNASGYLSTVGGGYSNSASDSCAAIAGGCHVTADGENSAIGGGSNNAARGLASTIPGGMDNLAEGDYTVAMGRQAQAVHDGSFVWADGTGNNFATTDNNQFLIRANGGVGIGTNNPQEQLDVAGKVACSGLQEASDIRFKNNIRTLNNALDKVSNLRGVTFEWNQNSAAIGAIPGSEQIGVVAQEVESVLPQLVSTSDDGYKSVDYTKLTAVLIEAVKELKADNDKLRAENNTLKEDLSTITNDIEVLKELIVN